MGKDELVSIDLVAGSHINRVFDQVKPLLQAAVDHNGGVFDISDVKEFLDDDTMMLLVARQGVNVIGAFCVESVKYPRKRSVRIVLAAGEPMDLWMDELTKKLDQLRQAAGYDFIELLGRKGWSRALKGYGYEAETVFRRI